MAVKNSKNTQFRTGEEQVAVATKGGIASGKARREEKAAFPAAQSLAKICHYGYKRNKDKERLSPVTPLMSRSPEGRYAYYYA